jgi:predicted transcriptional regulator
MLIIQHKGMQMSKRLIHGLSKRERQIIEIIYRKRSASVKDVLEEIPEPPSYSTVRALLNILESKGLLKHRQSGKKYIYLPTIPRKRAVSTAVKHMLEMYFNNSIEEAISALIETTNQKITDEEFNRLKKLIERARKEEE